ncbi:hypothetical protein A3D05_05535 [Candidatus Gottesmanbacteria bacterium RIFCSPHIGHO2_02_FULL_40_24]|uniref:Uncharacterized protein n=1 Tax=Candidatus Gottesmanbacteria bacterium RIFCSPHIGHO2_01_FULL_40_15 TaxID=1798376 RepID=A0A1F5Z6U8_9BACT|nr:MAG: hypothetical protein A2777_02170 [Candidatus Gottesmanbacteria bacterium RIFCSPHIGHO2_01_FULL_40_15]OGG16491.1 MAG: hypothetical protein A3D05_05535 [Candidatus Gottesmanbacteria bacterium RIFCSPHIGHO2_02_FULL_40_24]OGG22569.1 MAG: hypothetical protein A3B48_02010 [Candidatus Gottesmanbacteria bacterium RIFCSPLOWO2_01_FULL_40_10]OGG25604.1 MAG: hypothetical protein A3E42_04685 [Candidatus Gottesmanbacteria bacterium RIFCSPHIGHO2_12_FULL_40_13]OGG32608.1 MAG: hypothetical protein A3I80_0
MKKIWGALLGGGMLLAAAMPALASDTKCVNRITGPFSRNRCVVKDGQSANVNTAQFAYVNNNVAIRANTGGNTSNFNTITGGVDTGGIEAGVKLVTYANNTGVYVTQVDEGGGGHGSNSITGPFSTNTVYVNDGQNANVLTFQKANVNNNVNISANTGNNKCNFNTICKNGVESGDVTAGVIVKNMVNNAQVEVTQL